MVLFNVNASEAVFIFNVFSLILLSFQQTKNFKNINFFFVENIPFLNFKVWHFMSVAQRENSRGGYYLVIEIV